MSERSVARRAYVGPACPRCNMALDASLMTAGEEVCPACRKPFLATPFAPPDPRPEIVASMVEAGPEGGVPCARHAGNAAVANCSRCGVFLCALCKLDVDGMSLCPSCFDRLSREGVLSSARTRIRDWRGMSLSLGIFGCLLYFFGMITGPLTIFFAWLGFRQRKELNEKGGALSLVVAVLFGLVQIGLSVFLIYAIVSEL